MMPVIDSCRTMFRALSSVRNEELAKLKNNDQRDQREDGSDVAQLLREKPLEVEASRR